MKRLFICTVCLLLCLLTACGGTQVEESESSQTELSVVSEEIKSEPESSSPESEESLPEESSESSEASEKEKPVIVSADEFAWPNMEFETYDPASDLTYDEYFSEERVLDKSATAEKNCDIPGYKYVRGAETDASDWDDRFYWTKSYDNLYLYKGTTGERTLLAEVPAISRIMIFPDCLYLITDNAVWRCGRLGEDLTCVYEHQSSFYATDSCTSRNVVFFESEGEIWRLHVPSGTADKLCVIDDLPAYDRNDIGYIPYTNYAFFTFEGDDWYVFSSRTGEETKLSEKYNWESDFDMWAESVYELNTY